MSKAETIRRLRQGDLIRLCQHRFGAVLPDDDAGRDSLLDLLCLASLATVDPEKKMSNILEIRAPWMDAIEAEASVNIVNRMPIGDRWRISKELGKRHRLTSAERERLGLRNIAPYDMSKEQLAEQRRAKDRARKRRQRIEQKRSSRGAYLAQFANSINKTKPWLAFGISKSAYYKRKAKKRAEMITSGPGVSAQLIGGGPGVSATKR
jgi:hypothetical protein